LPLRRAAAPAAPSFVHGLDCAGGGVGARRESCRKGRPPSPLAGEGGAAEAATDEGFGAVTTADRNEPILCRRRSIAPSEPNDSKIAISRSPARTATHRAPRHARSPRVVSRRTRQRDGARSRRNRRYMSQAGPDDAIWFEIGAGPEADARGRARLRSVAGASRERGILYADSIDLPASCAQPVLDHWLSSCSPRLDGAAATPHPSRLRRATFSRKGRREAPFPARYATCPTPRPTQSTCNLGCRVHFSRKGKKERLTPSRAPPRGGPWRRRTGGGSGRRRP
jgi:hypothetical protein